jgi:hypothetical protein
VVSNKVNHKIHKGGKEMNISMSLTEIESNLILNGDVAIVSISQINKSSKFLKSVLSEDDFKLLQSEYNIDYNEIVPSGGYSE